MRQQETHDPPALVLRHGSTYNLDGENSHEESVSAKKRKLQDPVVEDVLAEIPGMKARRAILEMDTYFSQDSAPRERRGERTVPEFEMYSSQDLIWATEAVGEK
ncbi:hypothetical protein CSAL01_10846 [Colletotrichum salicis]|uniref:Uncharacterized protein n=1 Tax=Colletotrichum salicis TaxID=1209931 RepID=A0A135USM2_9PEZI|nr:hypothetical protein CSAL01_10846 [Colletotrichum salicis]